MNKKMMLKENENDYKMLNFLGVDEALKHVLERYDYNIDRICDGIGGFSMDYKYLGGKVVGFCDYDSKGIKIRIRNWSMLRDERGCWLGWGEEDSASNEGEYYTISYTRREIDKIIQTRGQQTLF